MKRIVVSLIILLLLFIVGICIVTSRQVTTFEKKGEDIVTADKPLEAAIAALPENDATSSNDLALIDIEIEQHGYYPSSEQERENLRQSYRIARDGANAKLTFHVTDSKGESIPDASFHAGFIVTDKKFTVRDGLTDKNGIFVAEGKTASEVNYVVEKDGYYMTSAACRLSQHKGADVKNGKWQPWNPTIAVTLKEKRSQVKMYSKEVEIAIPEMDKLIGYDFEKGDWLQPHGKGDRIDISIQYTEAGIIGKNTKRILTLTFPNENDGLFIYKKDANTPMFSIYEAEDVGYQKVTNFVKEWENGQLIENITLETEDYFVFRTHTETDGDGNITSAYYGKVTNPFGFGIGRENYVRFTYYFNPTPNDRNLEYGGNLFDERRK